MVTNNVIYCDGCGYVDITQENISCPISEDNIKVIGFIEEDKPKPYNGGGSCERKLCGCGSPTALKGIDSQGRKRYRSNCDKCRRTAHKAKGDHCESCGIKPDNKSLLDVDHIDGNRSNNLPSNLQTLCKVCHQEKTVQNKDFRKGGNKANGS